MIVSKKRNSCLQKFTPFNLSASLFVYAFATLFPYLFAYYSFINLLICLSVCSLVYSFVCVFSYLFIDLPICRFVRLLVHSKSNFFGLAEIRVGCIIWHIVMIIAIRLEFDNSDCFGDKFDSNIFFRDLLYF